VNALPIPLRGHVPRHRAPKANAATRLTTTLAMGAVMMAGAFVTGGLLAGVASRFGGAAPLVLVAIPLVPIVVGAMFSDPRLAVIGVFATFPIGSIALPAPIPPIEMAEAAVVVVSALVLLKRVASGRAPLRWPPAMWWVFALLIWTIVAFPSAVDSALAVKQIASLAGGFLFALVVATVCSTMRDVRFVLVGFVVVVAGIALTAVVGGSQFESELGGTQIAGRLRGAFDHPNQLGTICAMLALVAAGLGFGARSLQTRVVAFAAVPLLLAGLALSLSRGAWIGAGLGALYLAIALPQARRVILTIAVPLAIVAALLAPSLPANPQIQVVQERLSVLTVRSPYDDRPAIWAEAMREIQDDPITGQGPGSFPVASVRAASEASSVAAYHAHNVLLTWAAENGIPAAVLLVGFFVAVALAARRATKTTISRGSRRDRAMIAGMSAGLIAVLGQGPVDYTWRNTVVFVAISAMVGVLLGASLFLSESRDEGRATEAEEAPTEGALP
jgi:putative inorganic carbon (hco3(-)) transporter